MSDFQEFVKSRQKKQIINSSTSQELSVGIRSALATPDLNLSRSDREKFSHEVVKVARSDEVLTELSESIGEPREKESEDEFVERAKSSLAKILKQKLLN